MTNHPNRSKQQQPTHTPGPWVSENQVVIKVDVNVITTIAVVDVGANGIPRIFGNEERQANARLIGAAPELLAALKAGRSFIAFEQAYGRARMTANELKAVDEAMRLANAAIAKAEGR